MEDCRWRLVLVVRQMPGARTRRRAPDTMKGSPRAAPAQEAGCEYRHHTIADQHTSQTIGACATSQGESQPRAPPSRPHSRAVPRITSGGPVPPRPPLAPAERPSRIRSRRTSRIQRLRARAALPSSAAVGLALPAVGSSAAAAIAARAERAARRRWRAVDSTVGGRPSPGSAGKAAGAHGNVGWEAGVGAGGGLSRAETQGAGHGGARRAWARREGMRNVWARVRAAIGRASSRRRSRRSEA